MKTHNQTTFAKTIHKGGTSSYNPPERFEEMESLAEEDEVNSCGGRRDDGSTDGSATLSPPVNTASSDGMVARSSRKTDMYSFAIMAWEVLSLKKPFEKITSDIQMHAALRRNQRPPVADLPWEVPPAVVDMIQTCWSTDRKQRRTSVECYSIVNH